MLYEFKTEEKLEEFLEILKHSGKAFTAHRLGINKFGYYALEWDYGSSGAITELREAISRRKEEL